MHYTFAYCRLQKSCYVQNREWLLHSSDTSVMGAKPSNLSPLIDVPTYIPSRTVDCAHAFDLVLISVPSLYSNIFILPLRPSISLAKTLHLPQDTCKRCNSAGWDGFRHVASCFRNDCFTSDVSTCLPNFTFTFLRDMNLFIIHFCNPGKPEFLRVV